MGCSQRGTVTSQQPDRRRTGGAVAAVAATILVAASVGILQSCWLSGGYEGERPMAAADVTPLPPDVMMQTQEEADRKSVGCVSCHTQTDAPTMHLSPTVRLGCADCHGGSPEIAIQPGMAPGTPAYEEAMLKAHVQPRFPDAWKGPDGKLSSANPPQSYTLLNKEFPQFIRFINPGDLRVARQVCGTCHAMEVAQVEMSPMTTSGVFWSAAAYNNGIIAPAIGAQKTPFLGESYSVNGVPREIKMEPPPTAEELAKGVLQFLLPLPRWEILPPGDIFRVFERGGLSIPSSFPDVGSAPSSAVQGPSKEDPGKPDTRQRNHGPGTGLRIAVPVLNIHKTRLNDPHLSFLGTNDNPGDFRSSGCSACHVVYANDRSAFHSGPYAPFGNRGSTQTKDPTIPKQQIGHPLKHEFTKAI